MIPIVCGEEQSHTVRWNARLSGKDEVRIRIRISSIFFLVMGKVGEEWLKEINRIKTL